MDVVRLPRTFLAAVLVFLLLIPLAALEAALATRAQWWRLPYELMAISGGFAAALFLPLSILLAQGRRWALRATSWLGAAWVLASAVLAIRLRLPAVGFFTIFLGSFLTVEILWIRREMSRSYFDPQLQWFQALPKSVPGLVCHVTSEETRGSFRVSRIDEEGVFLFLDLAPEFPEWKKLFARGEKELTFVFRDREFRCQGAPVRILKRGMGGGFQFQGLSPDIGKNLGDFVESLRGEGYVA